MTVPPPLSRYKAGQPIPNGRRLGYAGRGIMRLSRLRKAEANPRACPACGADISDMRLDAKWCRGCINTTHKGARRDRQQ